MNKSNFSELKLILNEYLPACIGLQETLINYNLNPPSNYKTICSPPIRKQLLHYMVKCNFACSEQSAAVLLQYAQRQGFGVPSSTITCYRKHLRRVTALLVLKKIYYKKMRNKKEWTKSWFVRSKSCFATISQELTVKLYIKDIKNYIKMPE